MKIKCVYFIWITFIAMGSVFAKREGNIELSSKQKVQVKVELYNRGKEKIGLLYEKSTGAKELTALVIKQGQKASISVEIGCSVYHKVKGSKGPLILIITKEMHGTTQTINQ
jgi:hypothetical protein